MLDARPRTPLDGLRGDSVGNCLKSIPFSGFRSYGVRMSKKSAKIAALIAECQGKEFDAHYLGYFACFNQGLFFEAHDVLEELWLAQRSGPNYGFYKGLIQFAGAFVHLQKNRLRPAAALFKLTRANLEKYASFHEGISTTDMLEQIRVWLERLEEGNYLVNPLHRFPAPHLEWPCALERSSRPPN